MSVEEIEEGEEADDEDEEDLSSLYKTFREIYVFLAHICPKETGELAMQTLQLVASNTRVESLCGLSWIVASVGEAFNIFFIYILYIFFTLFQKESSVVRN